MCILSSVMCCVFLYTLDDELIPGTVYDTSYDTYCLRSERVYTYHKHNNKNICIVISSIYYTKLFV